MEWSTTEYHFQTKTLKTENEFWASESSSNSNYKAHHSLEMPSTILAQTVPINRIIIAFSGSKMYKPFSSNLLF
jgi:hypothetical protein